MTSEQIGQRILDRAQQFLGLHETAANAAWDNPATAGADPAAAELLRLMEATGWQKGWSYCASMVEAIWRSAYVDAGAPAALVQRIARLLTPSVMQSYHNIQAENIAGQPSRTPVPGAIFFMQKGQTGFGHAGLYVRSGAAGTGMFATIEGNTSDPTATATEAQDREGEGIYKKTRRLDFTPKPGLWLRGFFNPIAW